MSRIARQEYRSDFMPAVRAPQSTLGLAEGATNLVFHSCEDIRSDIGIAVGRALDRPTYFGTS